jgi:hypothetical protein
LSRPIIARLRSESHLSDRITLRGSHQRLLQQNLPKTDSCTAANGVRVAGSSHEDGGAIVGNAFTGAVDDAISEGFSEGRGHKFES